MAENLQSLLQNCSIDPDIIFLQSQSNNGFCFEMMMLLIEMFFLWWWNVQDANFSFSSAVRHDRMRGGRNKFGPMYKRDRARKLQVHPMLQVQLWVSSWGFVKKKSPGLVFCHPPSPPFFLLYRKYPCPIDQALRLFCTLPNFLFFTPCSQHLYISCFCCTLKS